MKTTLTKAKLLELIAEARDDASIYIHTRTESAVAAIATAKQGSHDELFFRLNGEIVKEADWLSLVVDFGWSK